ncbi:hypothetical protein EGM51_04345 [Verrucomicrobia bacterium S94]|nr:hypothetical protein EGM51_04345 [Verrucomicrobia bacterium S94]
MYFMNSEVIARQAGIIARKAGSGVVLKTFEDESYEIPDHRCLDLCSVRSYGQNELNKPNVLFIDMDDLRTELGGRIARTAGVGSNPIRPAMREIYFDSFLMEVEDPMKKQMGEQWGYDLFKNISWAMLCVPSGTA